MKKTHQIVALSMLTSVLSVLSSCSESKLEVALKLAGENRPELEKVLAHYSVDPSDSLKYRAARFLIENMPLHYNYAGPGVERFRSYYDSMFCEKGITRKELIRRAKEGRADLSGIYPQFDVEKLDHDFLIRHIDQAFAAREYPWAKDVPFEEFCQSVLPYRIGNELPEEWMYAYRKHLAGTIAKLAATDADKYTVVSALKDTLWSSGYQMIDQTTMQLELRPSDYLRAVGGACPEITRIGAYALRSVGLPVEYDYIIHWANRSQTHSWNSIVIDTMRYAFGISDATLGDHFKTRPEERLGKVYRHMFSYQPQSLPAQKGALQEGIPQSFISPFIKDVSELYFDGIDVAVDLTVPCEEKKQFVYLAIFDNRNWVPVAWSRVRRGKATFEKLEKGCAYLAMYYHNDRLIPASDPFTITKEGAVIVRKPDQSRNTVTLKRKYPIFFNQKFILARAKKGEFQVADNPHFRNARTIYITPEIEEIHPYYYELDESIAVRYIRYMSPRGAFSNMAEIGFYNPEGEKLVGEIIGTEGSYMNSGADKYKLFDNDPLTYFNAPTESRCWGGMAFETPQALKSVMFLPRNDDNFIQRDELYELFCCRDGKFVSLGQRIGDKTHMLVYDNVPDNALLWLRNHTKGKDERIFTYEDDKQVWW